MSLLSKDINLILNFLNEDTCGSLLTFEQISIQFQHGISKSDYIRVGNALVLLLQNRDLTPTVQQRLIIFYLFIEMYKTDQQTININPFAPIFLSILQINGEHLLTTSQKYFHWIISPVTKQERSFVYLLIINSNNNNKELLKKTPNQILQTDLLINDDNIQIEIQKLKDKIYERTQQVPALVQCHLPAVIDDPEINNYGFDTLIGGARVRSNDSRQTIEQLLLNNVMEQTIHPEYLRLVPPLHECTIDELVWLSPILNTDHDISINWDTSMCLSNTINLEIRLLMDKAYQGAINLQQQQKLLDELDNNPELIYHIGLIPSRLPILVENSPLISIHCLLKLISSNQMTEYLQSLVTMDMSLHSMEVVNRLSTSMELPQEFLQLYISTCIKTCEETKDKYLQNRFVRLVSVFIQSLIRNKVIDIKNFFLDVQGFCINFRHIKEAGALFQLIKTFDLRIDDNNDSTTTTSLAVNEE